jgi:hypothetical protein
MASPKTQSCIDGQLYLPRDYYIPMSTVITWSKTAEGFVIGSDGRNTDAETGRIISDDAQKIFSVEQSSVRLAYALAATARIGQGPGLVIFDFGIETALAFQRLAVRKWSDWPQYARALMNSIHHALDKARTASGLSLATTTETYVFIGGLHRGRQVAGHIHFFHGIMSSEADLALYPSEFNGPPFGSRIVFNLIDGDDPRFLQYSRPKRNAVFSLFDGIERAEKDIRAHYDPEALNVDPGVCKGVGGRVQIATVTLSQGFKWVSGFEPA